MGPVVQKQVYANLGFKVNQGFCFSCYRAFAQLIFSYSLKAAKVKILDKTNLQESTLLRYKTELKIDANPRLA